MSKQRKSRRKATARAREVAVSRAQERLAKKIRGIATAAAKGADITSELAPMKPGGNPDWKVVAMAYEAPVWSLKAQDMLAPAIILAWAAMAEASGVSQEKVNGAIRDAFEIARHQHRHGRKLPD